MSYLSVYWSLLELSFWMQKYYVWKWDTQHWIWTLSCHVIKMLLFEIVVCVI